MEKFNFPMENAKVPNLLLEICRAKSRQMVKLWNYLIMPFQKGKQSIFTNLRIWFYLFQWIPYNCTFVQTSGTIVGQFSMEKSWSPYLCRKLFQIKRTSPKLVYFKRPAVQWCMEKFRNDHCFQWKMQRFRIKTARTYVPLPGNGKIIAKLKHTF